MLSSFLLLALPSIVCLVVYLCASKAETSSSPVYGVDFSWPIHHAWELSGDGGDGVEPSSLKAGSDLGLGSPFGRATVEAYEQYMSGCANEHGRSLCIGNEKKRLANILEQPKQMKNFTKMGFKKTKLPTEVYEELRDWYLKNKGKGTELEPWAAGSTFGE